MKYELNRALVFFCIFSAIRFIIFLKIYFNLSALYGRCFRVALYFCFSKNLGDELTRLYFHIKKEKLAASRAGDKF